MKTLIDITQKIWRDPVGSNVLGALGYSVLSAVGLRILWPLVESNWVAHLAVGTVLMIEVLLIWVTLRRPSAIITTNPGARYFSRRTRRVARAVAVAVPVLVPLLTWAVALQICRSDQRTHVFVANFEADAQKAHYRVTRIIFEHLRSALKEFPDVVPQLIDRSVPWHGDPTAALTWSQRHRKAILIWGDFDTTRQKVVVTAHLRLLRSSEAPLQGWNETRSPLGELENFTVQDDLARAFAYGALLIAGITRFQSSDFDSAIRALTAAIDEAPAHNVNPALFFRGRSFFQIGEYKKAISDFSEILKVDPSYPYALNNRGASYIAFGNLQAGYADLSRAIAAMPSDPLAYLNRGSALYELRRFDEALSDFNHAIKLAPRASTAYMGRANVYDRMDQLNKALADYATAARLARNNPKIYFNRAIALHAHGRDKAAIEDMDTVLSLKQSVAAYEYRGHLLARTGRLARALRDYRSALRIASSDAERNEAREYIRDLGHESE